MKTNMFRIVGGLSALLWAGLLHALDVRGFACKQGDCLNGQGTVWNLKLEISMEGTWSNGSTVPGKTYVLASPLIPGIQFRQVYGQDGLLESGDMPLRSAFGMEGAFYNGSYGRIRHDFTHQVLAMPTIGVYNDGRGIEYRGRFEFLPSWDKSDLPTSYITPAGHFFFYGDRVDTEENEKETGLFVSDETFAGWEIRFFKANERYVTQIQQKYQHNLAQIKAEERAKEESDRNGFQWTKFGALMAGAAIGGLGHLDSGEKVKIISSMLQDSMPGQQGVSSFNKSMQDISAQREEQKVHQTRVAQHAHAQQEIVTNDAANNERLLKAAKESRQPRERLAQADTRNYGSSPRISQQTNTTYVAPTTRSSTGRGPLNETPSSTRNSVADGNFGTYQSSTEQSWSRQVAAPKIVVTRKSSGSGPGHKTEEDARRAELNNWELTKRMIEREHEQHLTYGRIIKWDAPTCTPHRGPRTKENPEGQIFSWVCNTSYTMEVVNQGSSGGTMSR